jgi:carboxypeptidase Taq
LPSPYAELTERFARIGAIEGALAILSWDSAVMMPRGASAGRGEQVATLRRVAHDLLVAPEVAQLLDAAEAAPPLDPWEQANLAEMRHRHRHAVAVPGRLVEALERATNACEMLWRDARAKSDLAALAPSLQQVVDLVREQAAAKADALGVAPYDALLDLYEPGLTGEDLDALLAPLPEAIAPILEVAAARGGAAVHPDLPVTVEDQRKVGRLLLERLGFDFAHGRLDESTHPFCGGVPDDVRLTTRYGEGHFVQALFGILHEAGHALYSQGLPTAWRHQPVGEARGMVVHESQSLLMEMQVCRGPAFLRFLSGVLRDAHGPDPAFTAEALAATVHRVERGLIRVEADEVTYPLHIVLRWRLERALLAGELRVADLPGAWNEQMRALMGVVPPDDRRGCLQDIHWPVGAIGYFPCYTLGALLAAQLAQALRAAVPDLDARIEQGEMAPLLAWLRANVHGLGRRFGWRELTLRATGRPLQVEPFLAHLRKRYLGAH